MRSEPEPRLSAADQVAGKVGGSPPMCVYGSIPVTTQPSVVVLNVAELASATDPQALMTPAPMAHNLERDIGLSP